MLQGKAFLGSYATPEPAAIYGFRDRMDERYDMSRAIRNKKYMYIRNFYPHRPQGTYLDYMFQTPTTQVWKRLFDEGKLNAAQSVFWKSKPAEELYDLESDPYQINNLADTAGHLEVQKALRNELKSWMLETKDLGFLPEGEMLERAGERSPYDAAREDAFPIDEYFEVASMASDPQSDDLEELLAFRTNSDSVVRFWVAQGLLIRCINNQQTEQAIVAAQSMVNDRSKYVQCIANEVLARYGNKSQRSASLGALMRLTDTKNAGAFVALTALNSLDWCQPAEGEVDLAVFGVNPKKIKGVPERYSSYVPRMISRISEIVKQEK